MNLSLSSGTFFATGNVRIPGGVRASKLPYEHYDLYLNLLGYGRFVTDGNR
jgi:hypothetical protein